MDIFTLPGIIMLMWRTHWSPSMKSDDQQVVELPLAMMIPGSVHVLVVNICIRLGS